MVSFWWASLIINARNWIVRCDEIEYCWFIFYISAYELSNNKQSWCRKCTWNSGKHSESACACPMNSEIWNSAYRHRRRTCPGLVLRVCLSHSALDKDVLSRDECPSRLWFIRRVLSSNCSSHWLQSYRFSPIWILLCRFKLLLSGNFLLQVLQPSEVCLPLAWVCTCSPNRCACSDEKLHSGHLNDCFFSIEWVFECDFNFFRHANGLLQMPQM